MALLRTGEAEKEAEERHGGAGWPWPSSVGTTGSQASAYPQAGLGYELDAIAVTVIGGTRLSGGKGGIVGTFLGVVIIFLLGNMLNFLNVDPFYRYYILAIIIITALLVQKKERKGLM